MNQKSLDQFKLGLDPNALYYLLSKKDMTIIFQTEPGSMHVSILTYKNEKLHYKEILNIDSARFYWKTLKLTNWK